MKFDLRMLRLLMIICSLFVLPPAGASEFTVNDIRVEGLQRISAGTVFNYLPVRLGQQITSKDSSRIIRSLYKTGFFKDVRLEREQEVLIIIVSERPAISQIDISGNKSIEDEQLLGSLKDIGLAEGRVFNRFVLDKIEQELRRMFFNQGKYSVKIETTVTPLERNRVAIDIRISEGATARIKQINVIGNQAFEDSDILDDFELSPSGLLSFLTKDDQYSRQKLAGDLEKVRSFYLDRGHINFKINSTQVSITPDKKHIYVTINIYEGDVYTIKDIKLAGDLVAPPEAFFPMINLRRGEAFSRKAVVGSSDGITTMLGKSGYAFANVNSIPDIDEENKEVEITFFVDPGKRVYVRRITMKGNYQTRDEVLRRELRQMEAGWFSSEQVRNSRERLQRLGYFEEVNVETPAVPGSTDQVDVDISVAEKQMGNLMAGLGFSQSDGIIFNASIAQNNFLGTGKRINLAFNTSKSNTLYQLGYTNPYYTIDGISRGFILSYRKTDFGKVDISNYAINRSRFGVNFGIPINDTDRIRLDFDLEDTELKLGSSPSDELRLYQAVNGDDFFNFVPKISWSHDSRDSAVMPTRGGNQSFSAAATFPGSDQDYYRLSYVNKYYYPLSRTFTLGTKLDLGYGDGYGDDIYLPPWELFYAGGIRSIRGFKDYSLGPKDSNGDPLGGNLRTVGGAEIFFPAPFKLTEKTVRFGLFVDGGNVFNTEFRDNGFDFSEFRFSTGISAFWLSPFGALGASIGVPINDKAGDDIENFQFTFGTAF
ncbi:MAG: outer membrane protein assembly factor BamA [Gammaproteobacteria bacterium]|nr:outer membrane protein assembly factor BamA [Gammaproteobacteria bacterium]